MDRLKPAANFRGVDMTITDEELDAIIQQIDRLIVQFGNTPELEETVDKLNSLKKVFCEFAYYDEIEKEVHCRLGYYELQLLYEIIIISLPKGENNLFVTMVSDPSTKKWVYKNDREENKN